MRTAYAIRFTDEDVRVLEELQRRTGLGLTDAIRISVRAVLAALGGKAKTKAASGTKAKPARKAKR